MRALAATCLALVVMPVSAGAQTANGPRAPAQPHQLPQQPVQVQHQPAPAVPAPAPAAVATQPSRLGGPTHPPLPQPPPSLTGDELRELVPGRTIAIATPVGAIPVKYRQNGTMTGQSWGLGQFTGTENDKGRWWVAENKLCQRWEVWLDAKANCFELRIEGKTVHWVRQDGRRGTATISP